MAFEPVLTAHVREPNSFTLDFYLQHGGYHALKTALTKKPETVPVMFLLGWCPDYYDQQDWQSTVFGSKASSVKIGYKSQAFDDLTYGADKEADPKKRDDMYQRAGRLLSQDAPVAWIYYDVIKLLQKPYVKDYSITPLGFELDHWTSVYVTKKS